MLNTVYTAAFILSFVYLFLSLSCFKNRISPYYYLLFVAIMLTNFGYMMMTRSTDLLLGLSANMVMYLGASFTTFFMLMCIADLCKFEIKTWVQVMFIIMGSLIFLFASSPGLSHLYYKEVFFEEHHGVGMLRKEYGPLHNFYPMYLLGTIGYANWFIIKSFQRRRDVSYINSILLVVSMTCVFVAYALEKLSGINLPLVPLAYAVFQTVVFVLLTKICMYDIPAISAHFVADAKSSGFLLCDSNGYYFGSDEPAKKWFPELNTLMVDCKIIRQDTDLLKHIVQWYTGNDKKLSAEISCGDKIIEVKHYTINERFLKNIHCFHMTDDTAHRKYIKLVEDYNSRLSTEVNRKTKHIRKTQDDILLSMAVIVENRDLTTGGHVSRTSDVIKVFVSHMLQKGTVKNINPQMVKCIIRAASLHDLGKIAIPDAVLNKPGKFTQEEYEIMKNHPQTGSQIVERILSNTDDAFFKEVAVNIARYHHEKWDGTGYPEGLVAASIPLEARIMALADVFDALVSKRTYKEKMDYFQAFNVIEKSSGSHFDPQLVKEFLDCKEDLMELYNSYAE